MGLLDNIGKKVTNASQNTVQDTKKMIEIARINSAISQEENKKSNIYCQIGQLYANLHENDYENEFMGLIGNLVDIEQKISNYKEQIQEIKGIQHCENCGAELQRGVAFCSLCGKEMPRIQKQENLEDYLKCSNCGAAVKKGNRFCTSCGHMMEEPIVANLAEQVAAKEIFVEKTCSNCGAKQTPDSIFCTECGQKL